MLMIDFGLPANGGISTTSPSVFGQILGGYATVGNTTWAGGAAFTFELNDAAVSGVPGTNWDLLTISGTLAITATNAVMSAADSIGPDPQRFYRLLAP